MNNMDVVTANGEERIDDVRLCVRDLQNCADLK